MKIKFFFISCFINDHFEFLYWDKCVFVFKQTFETRMKKFIDDSSGIRMYNMCSNNNNNKQRIRCSKIKFKQSLKSSSCMHLLFHGINEKGIKNFGKKTKQKKTRINKFGWPLYKTKKFCCFSLLNIFLNCCCYCFLIMIMIFGFFSGSSGLIGCHQHLMMMMMIKIDDTDDVACLFVLNRLI